MSEVYYNEFDLVAAKTLENLIKAGHIAKGVVDTRSIEDVQPDDLAGFSQCHFFAGIGVWSYALRTAEWDDDRPIWTGSCPCQPFSAAGEGLAFADERHLWPAFHHLIKIGKPPIVVGEQVASKAVDAWIDLVHADLEAVGYTFGSVPFPSAGVGAPHIRDRNYWVAHLHSHGCGTGARPELHNAKHNAESRRSLHGMDYPIGVGLHKGGQHHSNNDGVIIGSADQVRGMADATSERRGGRSADTQESAGRGSIEDDSLISCERPGPTNGFWSSVDWLGCTDGKWRPVEPGTSPLATGAAARVGRLRGYGNAINAEAARVWIECVMEVV